MLYYTLYYCIILYYYTIRYCTTVYVKIIAIQRTHFFAVIIHCIYFSEGLQLIEEVARLQFLLIAFISQQAFPHLFVSHLFLLTIYVYIFCCVETF